MVERSAGRAGKAAIAAVAVAAAAAAAVDEERVPTTGTGAMVVVVAA